MNAYTKKKLRIQKIGGRGTSTANILHETMMNSQAEGTNIIVVSALGSRFPADSKITDLLLDLWHRARQIKCIELPYREISKRFHDMICDLGLDPKDFFPLPVSFETLRDHDLLLSLGEYWTAQIATAYRKKLGHECTFVDSKDLIFLDRVGMPILEKIRDAALRLFVEETTYIVPGFSGCGPDGNTKLFANCRNSSDFTAALIAWALEAKECVFWKDVDGIYDSDPRRAGEHTFIPQMTHLRLEEILASGSNVLHGDAAKLLRDNSIGIHIRNIFKPEDCGTVVSDTGVFAYA